MCDADINRRAFTAASIAAGALIGAASVANAQAQAVTETDVSIKTPDGETDAALYTPPGKGPFPGVLIFTDIFGLRPAFRDMGRRLAASGYTVLVPNPFYRVGKAPFYETAAHFDFADTAARTRLFGLMGSIGASGALGTLVAALSIHHGTTHVCKNLEVPIRDLNFVRSVGKHPIRTAVAQSFAFGGHNAALLLKAMA